MRTRTYIWLLKTYAISAGMYAIQIWATPYLQQGKARGGQSPAEMTAGSVEEDVGGQRHHALLVCHARVRSGTPTVHQLVSCGFRLQTSCPNPTCFETALWNQSNSPTCDLCDADDPTSDKTGIS